MPRETHICNFDTGLGDLSRKEQADDEVVLSALRRSRRFSAFEASANQTIANTMTRLCRNRLTLDRSAGYPWSVVTHIDGEPLEQADERHAAV